MARTFDSGITLLDTAKLAIHSFVKNRTKDSANSQDRYLLISYANGVEAIRVSWGQPVSVLEQELKRLKAEDLTNASGALKTAFEFLNLCRMRAGIDNYGHGRATWQLMSSVIIHVTDGGLLTTPTTVQNSLALPLQKLPGLELTVEPFRWDQRLYTIFMNFDSQASSSTTTIPSSLPVSRNNSLVSPPITSTPTSAAKSPVLTSINRTQLPQHQASFVSMSEVTAGKVFQANNPSLFTKALEHIGSKCLVNNLVVSFQTTSRSKNGPPAALHRQIKVRPPPKTRFTWPIPENFLPQSVDQLPQRSSHPLILFSEKEETPVVVQGLPFDKYELEASQLTRWILSKKRTNICFPCFIPNSIGKKELGHPFAYLKPASTGQTVNLVILPYNYPALHVLMNQLLKVHRNKVLPQWISQMQHYLTTIPPYYLPALRTCFHRVNPQILTALGDKVLEPPLKPSVSLYINKIKVSSKTEFDNLMSNVVKHQSERIKSHSTSHVQDAFPIISQMASSFVDDIDATANPGQSSKTDLRELLRHGQQSDAESSSFALSKAIKKDDSIDTDSSPSTLSMIPRDKLLTHLSRMLHNVELLRQNRTIGLLQSEWKQHHQPIDQMGNFSLALARQNDTPLRSHFVELTPPWKPASQRQRANSSQARSFVDGAELDVDGLDAVPDDASTSTTSTSTKDSSTFSTSSSGQNKDSKQGSPEKSTKKSSSPSKSKPKQEQLSLPNEMDTGDDLQWVVPSPEKKATTEFFSSVATKRKNVDDTVPTSESSEKKEIKKRKTTRRAVLPDSSDEESEED